MGVVVVSSGACAAHAQRRNEQIAERAAEQFAHDAVEQEVDGTVNDHNDVPDVAERRVDALEDAVVDAAEEGEHALRQLGDNEAQHDSNEHRCRTIVLAGLLRLEAASFHLSRRRPFIFSRRRRRSARRIATISRALRTVSNTHGTTCTDHTRRCVREERRENFIHIKQAARRALAHQSWRLQYM